jgi:hypothetical protein
LVGATTATSRPLNRNRTLDPKRVDVRTVPPIAVATRDVVHDPNHDPSDVRSP